MYNMVLSPGGGHSWSQFDSCDPNDTYASNSNPLNYPQGFKCKKIKNVHYICMMVSSILHVFYFLAVQLMESNQVATKFQVLCFSADLNALLCIHHLCSDKFWVSISVAAIIVKSEN